MFLTFVCLNEKNFVNTPSLNFFLMVATFNEVPAIKHIVHPGNARRLSQALDDYSLTMQHALRNDLRTELGKRIVDDNGTISPSATIADWFDYLAETDTEFYNWCFPYCAVVLTKANLGYLHQKILHDFRSSLNED